MPELNRRRFLQVASAAGLAPAIPAFPASAATAASSTVTSAQMLWASLFARAGNVKNAQNLASAMGISNASAQGIYAKLIQTNAIAIHGASSIGRTMRPAPATPRTKPAQTGSIREDIKKLLADDPNDDPQNDSDLMETDTDHEPDNSSLSA